jgi:predicted trehalose synthase
LRPATSRDERRAGTLPLRVDVADLARRFVFFAMMNSNVLLPASTQGSAQSFRSLGQASRAG